MPTLITSTWLLSPPLWEALWLTLKLAGVTTLLLGVLGLPLARWLNATRTRFAPVIEALVTLPIVLPPTVIGFYLLVAFSPQHPPGSWWVALIDASRASGATAWRTFWRVHLPLARRGIGAGLTLGFAHTLGEFGVVLMIGGSIPGETRVASIALYDEVQKLNYASAHAFAGVLLVISFVLLVVVAILQRRSRV